MLTIDTPIKIGTRKKFLEIIRKFEGNIAYRETVDGMFIKIWNSYFLEKIEEELDRDD